jgi:hypothetical protein
MLLIVAPLVDELECATMIASPGLVAVPAVMVCV